MWICVKISLIFKTDNMKLKEQPNYTPWPALLNTPDQTRQGSQYNKASS